MIIKIIRLSFIIFSLLLIFNNCKKKYELKTTSIKSIHQITIGYSAPELNSGQTSIMNGFLRRAEKKGWKVIVANANSSLNKQLSQIEYFITKKVNAIVAVPIDSKKISNVIKEAKSNGIYFYTIDRAPIGIKIEMSVLADNFMGGEQAGDAMVKLLKKKYGTPAGTVLELQGDLRQNVSILRHKGFISIIKKYPKIKIISHDTKWQSDLFAKYAESELTTKKIDGIYLHSDNVGIPVILPLLEKLKMRYKRNHQKHIFIVTFDGSHNALEGIRDGYIDYVVHQPLTDYGIIVNWIEKEINGEEIKEEEIIEKNALWSPAIVKKTNEGFQLLLSTNPVTIDNVENPSLWGNQQSYY